MFLLAAGRLSIPVVMATGIGGGDATNKDRN